MFSMRANFKMFDFIELYVAKHSMRLVSRKFIKGSIKVLPSVDV